MMKLLLSVVVFIGAWAQCVMAWGREGHEITAAIAQALLKQGVAAKVSTLLGGASMADVSHWADDIKWQNQWRWTSRLHYVNTPNWECGFNASTDCTQGCVTSAIANYTNLVQLAGNSVADANIPLKFLIHYVGDVHQPLHVGFGSDEGGNKIEGYYYRLHSNLHEVWDTLMILRRVSFHDLHVDQDGYVKYLLDQLSTSWKHDVKDWLSACKQQSFSTCPNLWAAETAKAACMFAYDDVDGKPLADGYLLQDAYQNRSIAVVEKQLAKGGVRLAQILNSIIDADNGLTYAEE